MYLSQIPFLALFLRDFRGVFETPRSSRQEVFCKKGILENLLKIHRKTTAEFSFLVKLLASAFNFIKKRLWYRYLPMNFAKFLRTPLLQNIWQCVESVRIQSYSGPHFPHSDWMWRDRSISPFSLHIQSECGTRKTPNTDTFYTVRETASGQSS